MKRISKKYGVLINIAFLLLGLILSLVSFKNVWISCSLVLYVMSLIVNILLYKLTFGTMIGFFSIFYLFAWILHLSQIILGSMEMKIWDNIFYVQDFYTVKKALTYSFVFLEIICLVFYGAKKRSVTLMQNKYILSKIDVRFVTFCFWGFYGYKVFFRMQQVGVALSGGYLDSLNLLGSFQIMMCTFAEIFSVFYLKYICNKKKMMTLLLFLLTLECVFMLTGNRLYSAIYIMSLLVFIYPKLEIKKTNIVRNISIVVLGFILLAIVVGVRDARITGNVSFETVINFALSNNILTSFIREFGFTEIDLAVAVQNETQLDYMLGSSYYNAFFTIFPNVGGVFTRIIDGLYFVKKLVPFYNMNYGGSFIAESFINFKYLGLLVAIPIGGLVSKVDDVGRGIEYYSFAKQLLYVALVFRIFSWERGYFYAIFRIPIWITIAYVMYRSLLTGKIKIKSV